MKTIEIPLPPIPYYIHSNKKEILFQCAFVGYFYREFNKQFIKVPKISGWSVNPVSFHSNFWRATTLWWENTYVPQIKVNKVVFDIKVKSLCQRPPVYGGNKYFLYVIVGDKLVKILK